MAHAGRLHEDAAAAGPVRRRLRAGTRQNRPNKPGRYRFFLAHTWSTRLLPDGAYRVQVEASDTRGNKAVAAQPFTIANGV